MRYGIQLYPSLLNLIKFNAFPGNLLIKPPGNLLINLPDYLLTSREFTY